MSNEKLAHRVQKAMPPHVEPYYVPAEVPFARQLEGLARQLLREKLAKLEEGARDRFFAIWRHPFPKGDPLEQMTERQLANSIGLVDRTLEAAERRAARCRDAHEEDPTREGRI